MKIRSTDSSYAWNLDWDEWNASDKHAAAMRAAMSADTIGRGVAPCAIRFWTM